MPTITEKTVREIALEDPSSIRVFESLGIDYCCGGRKPLSDVCSESNVDFERVLKLLDEAKRNSQAPASGGWTSRPLRELIAHIVQRHHEYVRQETPRIEGLLTKVVAKHSPTHPEINRIADLFYAMSHELATHMLKEEHVLFPYMERMEDAALSGQGIPPSCFGTVERPIANMMAEHDDAGALLSQMRILSNGYAVPNGACPSFHALYRGLEEFERDLHQHIHLENNILFPRAIEMERAH